MSLTLHYHPLSSYCWKVLVGLYENDTPFTPHLVDLSDPAARAALTRLTPFCKFPVLRDDARDRTVPESTIILEYLAQHYPGKVQLVPADADRALDVRAADRFYDLHVHTPLQKIVGDKLRPEGMKDPHGVEQARATLAVAYAEIDRQMATRAWATGDAFTLADCAAMPALHYANRVQPLGEGHRSARAYLGRLMERPSVVRVMAQAAPYLHMFPG